MLLLKHTIFILQNMDQKHSQDRLFKFAITLWMVFSLLYIVYDQWQDFKVGQLEKAYLQGKMDFVNDIVERAQKCEPFNLYNTSKDSKVDLINVACLSRTLNDAAGEVSVLPSDNAQKESANELR